MTSHDPRPKPSSRGGVEPQGATEVPHRKGPGKKWLAVLAAVAAIVIAAVIGFLLLQRTPEAGESVKSQYSSKSSTVSSVIADAPHPGESSGSTETQIPGPDGAPYRVAGPILRKYESLDDRARQDLGAPTQNAQNNPDGGVFQQFGGGVIAYKEQAFVVWGKIRDKWNELGGSQGQLGYPTSDERNGPDGQKLSTFEHGVITWYAPGGGDVTVAPN